MWCIVRRDIHRILWQNNKRALESRATLWGMPFKLRARKEQKAANMTPSRGGGGRFPPFRMFPWAAWIGGLFPHHQAARSSLQLEIALPSLNSDGPCLLLPYDMSAFICLTPPSPRAACMSHSHWKSPMTEPRWPSPVCVHFATHINILKADSIEWKLSTQQRLKNFLRGAGR